MKTKRYRAQAFQEHAICGKCNEGFMECEDDDAPNETYSHLCSNRKCGYVEYLPERWPRVVYEVARRNK